MKLILTLATALAMTAPQTLQAQEQRPLSIQQKRTLTYPRAIGRIEVDRDDVITVAAPTISSWSARNRSARWTPAAA